ncbi:MAG: hypothetical protein ISS26_02650 [Candidatus Omnitrophica bacterium]|nr:hypothetical protein [Candidatus Omnitrophota bacterium]
MHTSRASEQGYTLLIMMTFIVVFVTMTIGMLMLINSEYHASRLQYESMKALYLAEAGIERAKAAIMATGGIGAVPSTFQLSDTGVFNDSQLDGVIVNISAEAEGGNIFKVTADATVRNSKRVVVAYIIYNPRSNVFDYPYFLNNWGWFYGSGITANGDVRSNGRFDFRYGPTVEGEIYAGQEIGGGENVLGKAGTVQDGEYIYQHPNSPILEMPNLRDLTYYETRATAKEGVISSGGTTIVSGVYGDDEGESGNIVLIGTPDQPIEINGPVVVRGDVVIRGNVTGQGTIYAGRNLYVAGNIEYDDPPNTSRPSSDDIETINQWVDDNAGKDIVGFAASENIVMGDYTSGNWQWLANNYLFGMGSEDVGQDGIPDTDDTGEDDGTFQAGYEDLDEDGVFDENYSWTDVQTGADITAFNNVPEGVEEFNDIATDNISKIEGIFYTNHSLAGWGNRIVVNGAIISKDEAVASYYTITMNYDERLHSRYNDDPNWLIDLELPFSEHAEVVGWWEEAP